MDQQVGQKKIKIAIGSDHAGYSLKEDLKKFLLSQDYGVEDLGCYSEESVDYPEFGRRVGDSVVSGVADKGIVVCGSGIGISIAANKVRGIRAALCFTAEYAKMSRLHNDSNILALGSRMSGWEDPIIILDVWLNTNFEGGRHQKRIEKIEQK